MVLKSVINIIFMYSVPDPSVSGAAPYMAKLVKDVSQGSEAARIALHGIVSAGLASAQGGNPLAAAAGGMGSAVMGDSLAMAFYGKKAEALEGKERDFISNLATAIGAVAGGSVGGDTFSAASGANAARVDIENNGMGCSAKTCPNSLGDDLMRGGGMGGGTAGGAAGAGLGVIIGEMLGGDDNKQSQPNVGKDMSDADKAEYGGAGSGTPGGWGPEDEENARNQPSNSNNFDGKFNKDDLVSSANEPINDQGLSSTARAWEKHAGRSGGTFDPLKGNVTQKNEAASQFVSDVLNNSNTVRTELSRGGVEYRLPDGKGIRYNADGSFSGFLDPKR